MTPLIEMTLLCKVDVTLPWSSRGLLGVDGAGGVDEPRKEFDLLKKLQRRFRLGPAASEIRSLSGRGCRPVVLRAQYRPTPGRETVVMAGLALASRRSVSATVGDVGGLNRSRQGRPTG
jgi:hypothetical protein